VEYWFKHQSGKLALKFESKLLYHYVTTLGILKLRPTDGTIICSVFSW